MKTLAADVCRSPHGSEKHTQSCLRRCETGLACKGAVCLSHPLLYGKFLTFRTRKCDLNFRGQLLQLQTPLEGHSHRKEHETGTAPVSPSCSSIKQAPSCSEQYYDAVGLPDASLTPQETQFERLLDDVLFLRPGFLTSRASESCRARLQTCPTEPHRSARLGAGSKDRSCLNDELLWGIVACNFWLLDCPGSCSWDIRNESPKEAPALPQLFIKAERSSDRASSYLKGRRRRSFVST